MKALVVTPYYAPKIGGLENYARQLSVALHQLENWDIVVATSNHAGRQSTSDSVDSLPVYRLGTWFKISNTPVNLLWSFKLRAIIKRERPDVIIAHTPVPSMADAAAVAAGRTPFILVYHAATLQKGDALIFNAIAKLYAYYESITFRKAQTVLAVSDYVKATMPTHVGQKTFVVPNAVWKRDILNRTQPDTTNFVFISSLDKTHSWKGLDHILEAMAMYGQKPHVEPATLTIIGDGDYRSYYEDKAAALGIASQVIFAGAQTGDTKDALLSTATALIAYPNSANDAFPTVFLEAWAKSVPVVAAAIGPIPSLIHDNVTGYLVPPADPTALAQKLLSVSLSSKTARARIARQASKQTADQFTWERQAGLVNQIAADLL